MASHISLYFKTSKTRNEFNFVWLDDFHPRLRGGATEGENSVHTLIFVGSGNNKENIRGIFNFQNYAELGQ